MFSICFFIPGNYPQTTKGNTTQTSQMNEETEVFVFDLYYSCYLHIMI